MTSINVSEEHRIEFIRYVNEKIDKLDEIILISMSEKERLVDLVKAFESPSLLNSEQKVQEEDKK